MTKKLFDHSDTFIGITDNQFETRLKNVTLKEKETLYIKAKDRYYIGDPIMTDPQFDRLEQWLDSEGSKVTDKVGGTDASRDKLVNPHMSPMLSLEKIQVNDEDNFPLIDIQSWNTLDLYPMEATPKFDGNAIELQYIAGVLKMAVTRGEHGKGADVTKKLIDMGVPSKLDIDKDIEIRGEVCMQLTTFKTVYQKDYKNARNLVAGILNPNNDSDVRVKDCTFVAYSIKTHSNGKVHHENSAMDNLTRLGFNKDFPVKVEYIKDRSDFHRVYDIFKNYRQTDTVFQLDGIVLKFHESKRTAIGENKKHPKWAMALKFPAKEATTTIIKSIWEVGYTGELSPVGLLEPVDLDGSEVTRVSLYNKTRMEENGTFPGAIVTIRKAGDIIPQIIRVEHPSPYAPAYMVNQDFWPRECPSCDGPITVEIHAIKKNEKPTEHLMCRNNECTGKLTRRLSGGVSAMKMKGIGDSICESLVSSGVKNVFDLFDSEKFNTQALCSHGILKPGRSLEVVMNAVRNLRQMDLDKVVLALQFEGLGNTGSKAVADLTAGNIKDFDGMGLEKSIVEPFLNTDSWQSQSVHKLISILKDRGVIINMPKTIDAGSIIFELTGSPDGTGYKTKEEFIDFMSRHGYVPGKLKNATVLVTDSYNSKTSKMVDAAKKGLKIITYEDLIDSVS